MIFAGQGVTARTGPSRAVIVESIRKVAPYGDCDHTASAGTCTGRMPLKEASQVIARNRASPGSWKRTNDPALVVIVVSDTVTRATRLGDGVGDAVAVGVELDAVGVGVGLHAVGEQPTAITTTTARADRRAMPYTVVIGVRRLVASSAFSFEMPVAFTRAPAARSAAPTYIARWNASVD